MTAPDPEATKETLKLLREWGIDTGAEALFTLLEDTLVAGAAFILAPLLAMNLLAATLDAAGLLPDFKGRPVPVTPPTPRAYGRGGMVSRPTLALLGEAGPEAVIPLGRLGDLTAGLDASSNGDRRAFIGTQASEKQPLTINVYATYNVSGEKVASMANEDLVRRLRNVLVPGI